MLKHSKPNWMNMKQFYSHNIKYVSQTFEVHIRELSTKIVVENGLIVCEFV